MSDDSFDASAKGRATESGAAIARRQTRHGGGGHGVVARIWLVATASLSLSRTGAGGRVCAVASRELGYHHAQDAGEPRAQSARACEQARHDDKRVGQAGRCGIPGDEAPAWLSGGRHGVLSISNTNSIDCSPPSSNWLTTSWFLIGSGSSAAQR
jgi:hypothetical protein